MSHWLTTCTLLLLATMSPLAATGEDAKPIRVVVWDEQQPAQKQAYETRQAADQVTADISTGSGDGGLQLRILLADDSTLCGQIPTPKVTLARLLTWLAQAPPR